MANAHRKNRCAMIQVASYLLPQSASEVSKDILCHSIRVYFIPLFILCVVFFIFVRIYVDVSTFQCSIDDALLITTFDCNIKWKRSIEKESRDAIMSIQLEMPNWGSLIIIIVASIIGGLIIRHVVRKTKNYVHCFKLLHPHFIASLFLNLRHIRCLCTQFRIWFNVILPISKSPSLKYRTGIKSSAADSIEKHGSFVDHKASIEWNKHRREISVTRHHKKWRKDKTIDLLQERPTNNNSFDIFIDPNYILVFWRNGYIVYYTVR